jgi:MOSC domain-containing protein YiiM
MFEGKLIGIFAAEAKSGPMQSLSHCEVIAGLGLVGDRHGADGVHTSRKPETQITLIESESLDAAVRDCDFRLGPSDPRRNLLTRDVPLNHLVGREFWVGEIRLRGIRLCEPCEHLQKLTRPGVREALAHRGGLRAEVLAGGLIKVSDLIRPVAQS